MRWGYLAFKTAWIELVGSHFCLHTGFDTILTDTSFVICMWGKTFPATAHESAKCVKTRFWTTSVVDHAFVDICAGRKEKCPSFRRFKERVSVQQHWHFDFNVTLIIGGMQFVRIKKCTSHVLFSQACFRAWHRLQIQQFTSSISLYQRQLKVAPFRLLLKILPRNWIRV